MSLANQLDGAQLVVFDDELRLLYAWFGGTGVNVYGNSFLHHRDERAACLGGNGARRDRSGARSPIQRGERIMTHENENSHGSEVIEHASDAKREREAKLVDIIFRQQELIVKQTENLVRAMEALATDGRLQSRAWSLFEELDELMTALTNINAEDLQRAGDFIKSMFDNFNRRSVDGGDAVASTS